MCVTSSDLHNHVSSAHVCVCVFVIIATVSTVTFYSNISSSVIVAVLDIKINAQLATSTSIQSSNCLPWL
jgi:hypothetical protein